MIFRGRPDRGRRAALPRDRMKGDPERRRTQGGRGERVRCPRCGWEPRASDRWGCTCGHAWNTFETGGVCPACAHEWQQTQCRRCGQWSHHRSWYCGEE